MPEPKLPAGVTRQAPMPAALSALDVVDLARVAPTIVREAREAIRTLPAQYAEQVYALTNAANCIDALLHHTHELVELKKFQKGAHASLQKQVDAAAKASTSGVESTNEEAKS